MSTAKPSIPELLRVHGPSWRERFSEADEEMLYAIMDSPFSSASARLRAEITLQMQKWTSSRNCWNG